jgi:hypothetical protein
LIKHVTITEAADILREQLDGAVGTEAESSTALHGRDETFWENNARRSSG